QVGHRRVGRMTDVDAGKGDRAFGDFSRAVEDAHHRIGGNGFSGAGLADDADSLTLADLDIDRAHGRDRAAARRELDGEVLDVEQGDIGHGQVRREGSKMSRNPSPSRLKQNTAVIKAAPGKSAIHHSPDTMKAAPSATMMPHSGVGGRTPRPMKESPAAL